jgi:hypothetical protein
MARKRSGFSGSQWVRTGRSGKESDRCKPLERFRVTAGRTSRAWTHRASDLRLLRTLGLTPRALRRLTLTEGATLGLLGATFGVVVGAVAAHPASASVGADRRRVPHRRGLAVGCRSTDAVARNGQWSRRGGAQLTREERSRLGIVRTCLCSPAANQDCMAGLANPAKSSRASGIADSRCRLASGAAMAPRHLQHSTRTVSLRSWHWSVLLGVAYALRVVKRFRLRVGPGTASASRECRPDEALVSKVVGWGDGAVRARSRWALSTRG